jgi:hypothetical protein
MYEGLNPKPASDTPEAVAALEEPGDVPTDTEPDDTTDDASIEEITEEETANV